MDNKLYIKKIEDSNNLWLLLTKHELKDNKYDDIITNYKLQEYTTDENDDIPEILNISSGDEKMK